MSLPPHRARHLVDRLEGEGLIARVGERRRAGRRGRAEIVCRVFGRGGRGRSSSRVQLIGAKTINNSLIPLRVALGHAVEDGLIARNPAASPPGARERIKVAAEQPEIDFLRLSEIPRYLEACASEYRPLAEILIACGLRISEAIQLTWAEVDFAASVLLVTGSRKSGRSGGQEAAAARSSSRTARSSSANPCSGLRRKAVRRRSAGRPVGKDALTRPLA